MTTHDTTSEETDHGSDVVDIVAIQEEDNLCILGLVDLMPWGEGYERVRALEERLKTYVAYWDSGQLLADFPAARYAAVRIKVFLQHLPDAEGEAFLEQTSTAIQTLGIGFDYEQLPS